MGPHAIIAERLRFASRSASSEAHRRSRVAFLWVSDRGQRAQVGEEFGRIRPIPHTNRLGQGRGVVLRRLRLVLDDNARGSLASIMTGTSGGKPARISPSDGAGASEAPRLVSPLAAIARANALALALAGLGTLAAPPTACLDALFHANHPLTLRERRE